MITNVEPLIVPVFKMNDKFRIERVYAFRDSIQLCKINLSMEE